MAFIQASMPYMKAGAVVCTVGPFKVAASQGLLSLFCELLLCSLAQQSSAGNAILLYSKYTIHIFLERRLFFIFFFF